MKHETLLRVVKKEASDDLCVYEMNHLKLV